MRRFPLPLPLPLPLLVLGGLLVGAVVLLGGIALGDTLRDSPGAEATTASGSPTLAAMPAGGVPLPDATIDPVWPHTSPVQVIPAATDEADATPGATPDASDAGAARFDGDPIGTLLHPETGIDSGGSGEPFIPPTSPIVEPTSGADGDDAPGGDGGTDTDTDTETGTETDTDTGAEAEPEPELGEPPVDELSPDEVADLFLPVGLIDDIWILRFTDPCAGDAGAEEPPAGDECPEGVGGTIVEVDHDDPPPPLSIMRQMYTSIGVPLELRCSPLGMDDEGVHRAIFASNNPADFTIRYWPSTSPDDAREVAWATPDAEIDRWVARRIAHEPIHTNMHTGVHNCPPLEGLRPGVHTTIEIHGVDAAGSEADVRFSFTPDHNRDGAAVGRPRPSFEPIDDIRGLVTVPYDEDAEAVYVASLPRTGARATTESCTDVENSVLDRTRRADLSIYDWDRAPFPRTDDDGFLPGIETSTLVRFAAEEGTTYDVCVWVTQPPRRSFDKPTVVLREVIEVRGPRHLRARIWLTGGYSNVALDRDAIRIDASNWPSAFPARWPDEPLDGGPFSIAEPVLLHEGGSSSIPPNTLLRLKRGARELVVTLPTPTGCVGGDCAEPSAQEFSVPFPGRAALDGVLRLIVETYAGPAGRPNGDADADGWQVSRRGHFAASGRAAPSVTPQLDLNNSTLTPVGGNRGLSGGRPSILADLRFDRAVEVTAVPRVILGAPCPIPAEPQTVDAAAGIAQLTFEGLCWGSSCSLDFIATDRLGNVLNVRAVVDGEPTGRAGWSYAELPAVEIESYRVAVTFDGLARDAGASFATLWVGRSGFELIDRGASRCIADGSRREYGPIRNGGGYPLRWGDPVVVELDMRASGDGRSCGDRTYAEHLRFFGAVPIEQLAAGGPVTLRHTDHQGTDVTIEIYDVVFG